jgi:hypothetical protein
MILAQSNKLEKRDTNKFNNDVNCQLKHTYPRYKSYDKFYSETQSPKYV